MTRSDGGAEPRNRMRAGHVETRPARLKPRDSTEGTMLVLTRRKGESILLSGGITLTVVRVKEGRVKLGIEAPRQTKIVRGELLAKGDNSDVRR